MPLEPAAQRLLDAGELAYRLHGSDCSGAVNEVLRRMSTNPDDLPPRLSANDLLRFLSDPSHMWRQVTSLEEAQDLANHGVVVVGGVANPSGHGHVLVVMPGDMRPAGGFFDGKIDIQPYGRFPLALSTSMTGYVGAMSKGDKTIRDPFNRLDWLSFKLWTHVVR